jgi:nuclear pore complex protein Nup205
MLICPDFDRFLQYMHTKLAFLLQFSRTRSGATAILGAGFMQTIKESRIFSVDPDVGLEMQDSDTLRKYFDLLIALMRVIIGCVSSRGQQNEQTLTQAKKFISDNRLTILTIFKRSAGIGSPVDEKLQMSIEDLADAYMMLMTLSRFLDVSYTRPTSG